MPIHLVDIKKIKVHEQLDSYASLGHLIKVCQCYLSNYEGIYPGLPSNVFKFQGFEFLISNSMIDC